LLVAASSLAAGQLFRRLQLSRAMSIAALQQASLSPVRSTPSSPAPATPRRVYQVSLSPIRSTPSSPAPATPRQVYREPPTTPPPAPRPGLLHNALVNNLSVEVARILDGNEFESIGPIKDLSGCEPPLVKAARYGCSADILKQLLRHGASADSLGNKGLTPLMIIIRAHTNRVPDLASYLTSPMVPAIGSADQSWMLSPMGPLRSPWTCEPNVRDGFPRLSEDQCIEMATCLLQSGADALQVDTSGQCAPGVAERLGKPRLAALLKYWCELRACRLLRILWQRSDEGHSADGWLLMVPETARNVLCQFLVPDELDYSQVV